MAPTKKDVNLFSINFYAVKANSNKLLSSGYGLDGLGIKSWWGKIFHTHPDRPWGPHNLLYNADQVIFPGGCGHGVALTTCPPTPT
jgi:hypothetical protein